MAGVQTKTAFWRMYAAAFACYCIANLVGTAASHAYSLAYMAGADVFAACLFGVLAAFVPRTAVCVLTVTAVIGTWNLFWAGIFDGWWWLALVPVNLIAVYLAVRAYPRAAEYVASERTRKATAPKKGHRARARHREEMARDYDRNQPW